jgi:hypothetical protein
MRNDNVSIALNRKIDESVYCYRIPQTSFTVIVLMFIFALSFWHTEVLAVLIYHEHFAIHQVSRPY